MSEDYAVPSIFISHSSKDIQIARAVRNLLEDRDHFVGFFGWLQDMTEYEIYAFLDKEIKKHTWLTLIDTDNAQRSEYVQFEIKQAKHYDKPMYAIDAQRFLQGDSKTRQEIEADDSLINCVEFLSRSFHASVLGLPEDKHFHDKLNHQLRTKGFITESNPLHLVRQLTAQELRDHLWKIASQGVFINVISPRSKQQDSLEAFHNAKKYGMDFMLPVIIEDPQLSAEDELTQLNWLDVSRLPDDEKIARILEEITRIRHDDFAQTCGRIIT